MAAWWVRQTPAGSKPCWAGSPPCFLVHSASLAGPACQMRCKQMQCRQLHCNRHNPIAKFAAVLTTNQAVTTSPAHMLAASDDSISAGCRGFRGDCSQKHLALGVSSDTVGNSSSSRKPCVHMKLCSPHAVCPCSGGRGAVWPEHEQGAFRAGIQVMVHSPGSRAGITNLVTDTGVIGMAYFE